MPSQADGASLGVLETAALLRELTAGMVASDDFDDALDHLAQTTRHALPGIAWSSVTLLRAGEPASVAASDPSVKDLDELQYGADGPGMTAIRRREIVLSEELASEQRWPEWTPAALARGVHAVLSAPVDIDDHVIGSINFYAADAGALTPAQQLTAMLLAEHAGLLLAAVRDRARQAALTAEIDDALTYGEVISQAIGIVMTQRRCAPGQALDVLRTAAEALSIPLPDVAERLVASVERDRDG
ncbi:GAF and ANTAR domain-containing protein [Micromonospora sp. NPDC049679]|uniref:GAF and ANTAR domain-containing protein n=1 Tax=Micromonospora sp. NPDC049679 TaxID=3155920 RepID=UPI0033D689E7